MSNCKLPFRKDMAKTIAGYAAAGLRVVKLYRPEAVGVCNCNAGARCPNPGKHPIGTEWHNHAVTCDEDTIMQWWEDDHTAPNVGVILGPRGGLGVIDVEADSEEGEAVLRELGLERFETATYQSGGKSPHRLFLWEEGLPPVAKFEHRGLEVRIGGGEKAAQSVLPPSCHSSGRLYQWCAGFGIEDVGIAPIPPELRKWIMESWSAKQRGTDGGGRQDGGDPRALLHQKIKEGGRHDAVIRLAGFLSRSVRSGDPADESDCLDLLLAANSRKCAPPLPDDEVAECWRYAVKQRRKDSMEANVIPGIKLEEDGGTRRYVPDGLELTIVKSDPPAYRLSCAEWRRFNGTGIATLTAEDFMSAKKAAVALASQVGGLALDPWPGEWARIWDGKAPSKGQEPVAGLRSILVNEAMAAGRVEVVTDPAQHRLRRLAYMLVNGLRTATEFQDHPARVEEYGNNLLTHYAEWIPVSAAVDAPEELWFSWEVVWDRIVSAHKIEANEGGRLVGAMEGIIGRKLAPERKQVKGNRHRYRKLTQEEWSKLEAFAIGDAVAGGSGLYSQPVFGSSHDEEKPKTPVHPVHLGEKACFSR
jgi:hypothetical protein